MSNDPNCLHCAILDLAERRRDLTVNEVLFKLAEATADVIAGVGDRPARRRILAEFTRELKANTARSAEHRRRHGVPPYPKIRLQ